jgi:hypothetical protein
VRTTGYGKRVQGFEVGETEEDVEDFRQREAQCGRSWDTPAHYHAKQAPAALTQILHILEIIIVLPTRLEVLFPLIEPAPSVSITRETTPIRIMGYRSHIRHPPPHRHLLLHPQILKGLVRKVDFPQYLAALGTRFRTESEETVDARLAHLVIARRDEETEVLVELSVGVAYGADVLLRLNGSQHDFRIRQLIRVKCET